MKARAGTQSLSEIDESQSSFSGHDYDLEVPLGAALKDLLPLGSSISSEVRSVACDMLS